MAAPDIDSSTREERLNYVLNEWKCLHNCRLCGKCYILRGSSEEQLYADYIEGKRSYMDITLEIRKYVLNLGHTLFLGHFASAQQDVR